jgi:signal transduction histidine kinase
MVEMSSDPILSLVRAIHDDVVQRLAGVSMALSDPSGLSGDTRERAADEVAEALARLRGLLASASDQVVRSPRPAPPAPPEQLADVVRAVLAEALRNAHKHACSTAISIALRTDQDGVMLEVLNDDASKRDGNGGIGLRIAELEAELAGGTLEAGPTDDGRWRLRLQVPD